MKYYVLLVGMDGDYELEVCDTLEDAKDMVDNSCGIAVFDVPPVYTVKGLIDFCEQCKRDLPEGQECPVCKKKRG